MFDIGDEVRRGATIVAAVGQRFGERDLEGVHGSLLTTASSIETSSSRSRVRRATDRGSLSRAGDGFDPDCTKRTIYDRTDVMPVDGRRERR